MIFSVLKNCWEGTKTEQFVVFFHVQLSSYFWVAVWLLKSEQIRTELRDDSLQRSGAFSHWKSSHIYQCLLKNKTKAKNFQATTMPFVWSVKDCASILCLHLHYMCAIPFTVPFWLSYARQTQWGKTHESRIVVKLHCGFLSQRSDAIKLPLRLSLPTEICGINTPYVSSSFLVQLCLTKVHLICIYKRLCLLDKKKTYTREEPCVCS